MITELPRRRGRASRVLARLAWLSLGAIAAGALCAAIAWGVAWAWRL